MSLFQEALLLEQSNRFSEAFLLFVECLRQNTHDRGDLLFHIGWCLEHSDEKYEAVDFYEIAVFKTGIPITKINASFRAGWILMGNKQYRQASEFYKMAIDFTKTFNLETEIYPHAVYWHAVCLETLGQSLEAIEWYGMAQTLSPMLDPESRYRQIHCFIQIGSYGDALRLCRSFQAPAPQEFSTERYRVLQDLARRERQLLESALSDDFLTSHLDRVPDAY